MFRNSVPISQKNSLPLYCKAQLVNWESYKTHKYIMWANCGFAVVKARDIIPLFFKDYFHLSSSYFSKVRLDITSHVLNTAVFLMRYPTGY
jgi:hypothetical protein